MIEYKRVKNDKNANRRYVNEVHSLEREVEELKTEIEQLKK